MSNLTCPRCGSDCVTEYINQCICGKCGAAFQSPHSDMLSQMIKADRDRDTFRRVILVVVLIIAGMVALALWLWG
jgi:transcription initiation factor TFIIIB Brf1 subunit/transcription initiation factor TFIIB